MYAKDAKRYEKTRRKEDENQKMQDDKDQLRVPFPDYLPEQQQGDANSYYSGYRNSTMLKNVEVFIIKVDEKWNALIVGKRHTTIIQPDGNPNIKEFRQQLVEDFQEEGYYPRIRHLDNTGLEFKRDEKLAAEIEKLTEMKKVKQLDLFKDRSR